MRKRSNRVEIKLSDDELGVLENNLAKTHMSRSAYIRKLIMGVVPKELPTLDYISLTKQLRYIGNNINQLAMNSHKFNNIDAVRYDRDYKELQDVYKMLMSRLFDEEKQNGTD